MTARARHAECSERRGHRLARIGLRCMARPAEGQRLDGKSLLVDGIHMGLPMKRGSVFFANGAMAIDTGGVHRDGIVTRLRRPRLGHHRWRRGREGRDGKRGVRSPRPFWRRAGHEPCKSHRRSGMPPQRTPERTPHGHHRHTPAPHCRHEQPVRRSPRSCFATNDGAFERDELGALT